MDGELYIDDLSFLPKIYQQLYSFHYGLEHLGRDAVRGTVSWLASRWTGGFSAVNIFTGLRSVIPSIHRVKITELRYNSPGHIELNLLPKLAAKIEKSADMIKENEDFEKAENFYKSAYRYFKKNKISGFEDENASDVLGIPAPIMEGLEGFVSDFFEILGWHEYKESFSSIEANPLQQIRMLLAYYRRLRKLRPYIVRGNLKLGVSSIRGE